MITEVSGLRMMFQEYLETFHQQTDCVQFVILASEDGFPVAYTGIEPDKSKRASAMASTLYGLAGTIVKEFDLQALDGAILECELGVVLCRSVQLKSKNFVVLAVVDHTVVIGHALWSIKNLAKKMSDAIRI